MLMTCGKLSGQAPFMKVRLSSFRLQFCQVTLGYQNGLIVVSTVTASNRFASDHWPQNQPRPCKGRNGRTDRQTGVVMVIMIVMMITMTAVMMGTIMMIMKLLFGSDWWQKGTLCR